MQLNNTFNQLLLSDQLSLKQFAFKFTQDLEDAEDLLQETMLKALRYHNQFKEGTNMNGWLFTIMRNTFINSYNADLKKKVLIATHDEISSEGLMESSVRNQCESRFVREDIDRAMSSLPQVYSMPFLRYFEGYKYDEIAAELQIPLGTVKTRIYVARGLLQKQLEIYRK